MNQTLNQTASISITPFFLCLWWCWKRKSLCCSCKCQVSHSQGRAAPGCRHNPQELRWAMGQQKWANGLTVQSSFSQGLPVRSRHWTLEWDSNYSWSKIYCRHWFCSMKYLQKASTDSLTWLKINWTVFRFFGMEWGSSRSASHMNDLFLFFFFHHSVLYFRLSVFDSLGFFTTLCLSVPPTQPLLILFFF